MPAPQPPNSDRPLAGTILDGIATGIFVLTATGHVRYMNAAAEFLASVSARRADGRHISELFIDTDDLERLVSEALRIGGPVGTGELPVTNRHGTAAEHLLDCRVTPLDGPGANGDTVYVELLDAGARLRVSRERALHRQQDITRGIVRQLAHEIKNPLGGIRGAAQLLQRELADVEQREYTDVIIGEADRLVKLVNRMLGPGVPGEPVRANVHELLRRVRTLLQSENPGSLTIREDYDPSIPALHLDTDQVLQALLNLVRNAAEALNGDGEIVLRTRAVNGQVIGDKRHALVARIDIEDNGPGVPEELAESVFLPLVTGRTDGTGLGLAIAQELVSRNGGIIELDRHAERTVFSVYLPANGEVSHD